MLGHAPDAYAVYAYETTVVVIQALDKVGEKDRGKILDAHARAPKDFVSLLGGTWSFTETGDTDSAIIGLSQIEERPDQVPEDDRWRPIARCRTGRDRSARPSFIFTVNLTGSTDASAISRGPGMINSSGHCSSSI